MTVRVAALLLLLVQAQQIAVPAFCMPMHRAEEHCHAPAPLGAPAIAAAPQAQAPCAESGMCAVPAPAAPSAAGVGPAMPDAVRDQFVTTPSGPPSTRPTPPTPPPQG
jgi:hypothetical protein